ncbi:MAG: glycosyltransferase family 4 protein [Terriglobales bacterium]
MRMNFVSNLSLQEISGGFSGMNAACYEALTEIAEVHYVGPVNPPVNSAARLISKLKRSAGRKGKFFFFSDARLRRIAEEVNRRRRADVDFDFYFGFTPWIRCIPSVPYLTGSDCSFRDYLDIYHPGGSFLESDIVRICSAENAWMRDANAVFFSSEWALLRTKAHYGLERESLANVSIFGALDIPPRDTYTDGREFLFISSDYVRKNGSLCRRAMNQVWHEFPEARLKIIGAAPPAQDLTDSRVTYEGHFDKSKPEQLAAFTSHLSRAFALVHPTAADITPMIVIEAALHGCPCITVNDFGLPEVTGNGTYALLQNRPLTADTLARAMIELLDDMDRYRSLRAKAREFTIGRFSRAAFKRRLQEWVLTCIANVKEKCS